MDLRRNRRSQRQNKTGSNFIVAFAYSFRVAYRLKFRDNNPWEFAIALFTYAILFAFCRESLLNDNKKTIAMLFLMALLIVIV